MHCRTTRINVISTRGTLSLLPDQVFISNPLLHGRTLLDRNSAVNIEGQLIGKDKD